MTITPVNQKNDELNQFLDRAELGEAISLMRDGSAAGSLVNKPDGGERAKASEAAARILHRRVGVHLSHDEVKDLIAEGRA